MTIIEAVILAGGEDKRLAPLTAPDQPKCLLPVANCPVLMYSLKSIKAAGVQSAIVVVCGADAANKVQNSLRKENLGNLKVQVVTADSQSGSADAVRAVADRLRGDCVVVMSGDVVTDIPLNALVFNHNIRGASITTVLCKHKSSPAERTKVGKAPKGVDYVALDEKKGRLMSYAYDPQQLRSVQVCKAAIEACSPLNLTTEYRDACIYVLNKAVVEVIRKDAKLSSIKLHLLPKLVNEQWDSEVLSDRSNVRSEINEGGIADEARTFLSEVSPEWGAMHEEVGEERFCGVYLVGEKHLCFRVNNVEALLECNREVANFDPEHPLMPGHTLVHPTVEQGNKTTIASSCIVGEGSTLGDKTSIKRSVIGASCKIGVNVKIINSVIMNGCTVGDGAHIQSSVIGHSVNIGSKVLLKECHVGHGCIVPDNEDLRGESLTSDKQS